MSLATVDKKYFKMAVGLDRIGKETDVDVAARCPICGDSSKRKRLKRLHLYNKGSVTNVSCFNGTCPCKNKTVYSFLRDFYPALLTNYKKETFTGTMNKLAGDVFANLKTDKPAQTEVQCQDLSPYLTKIDDSKEALEYLEKRGLPYTGNFGQWYFGHQNLKIGEIIYPITDNIVIPLLCFDEMYGFYSRSIKDKSFYTYMDNANAGFKIWNWFKVDKSKPVYIYEGIFDAIAGGLPNSIALMGAKLPDARLKELKHPVFVLDNDTTGINNAVQYSKLGHEIYIQPNNYTEKDMNDLMLNNPDTNTSELVLNNLFSGISAEIRLKAKL